MSLSQGLGHPLARARGSGEPSFSWRVSQVVKDDRLALRPALAEPVYVDACGLGTGSRADGLTKSFIFACQVQPVFPRDRAKSAWTWSCCKGKWQGTRLYVPAHLPSCESVQLALQEASLPSTLRRGCPRPWTGRCLTPCIWDSWAEPISLPFDLHKSQILLLF